MITRPLYEALRSAAATTHSMLIWTMESMLKPSMTKVMVVGILMTSVLTIAAYEFYPSIAGVPLSWLLSFGSCSMLYVIDRWGFSKLDTIQFLREHPRMRPVWIGFYLIDILASHALGFYATGG